MIFVKGGVLRSYVATGPKYEFYVDEKKLDIQSLIEIMTQELEKSNT